MSTRLSQRTFILGVACILLCLFFLRQPDVNARVFSATRTQLFSEFRSSLEIDSFSPAEYWEFRERFSPGNFLRDTQHVGFFQTFRIINRADEALTPLFYYESPWLKSLDGISTDSPQTIIEKTKQEFSGEIIAETAEYILIQMKQHEYIFVFTAPVSIMQEVNGLFDYLPEEQKLLDNTVWYNATYLEVE